MQQALLLWGMIEEMILILFNHDYPIIILSIYYFYATHLALHIYIK